MTGTVRITREGHIGVVEIDGPGPNFVDGPLMDKLVARLATLEDGSDCRAIVITSTGKHFCAGANFGPDGIGEGREAAARQIYRAATEIFDIGLPIIAAVQGAAVGAGLGLACAADFRVATPSSRFQANFTRLGFHHGFALTTTLPRIVGQQRAMEMLYGGNRVDGGTARDWGLVDRLAADGTERAIAMDWAAELAECAPLALRAVKQTMRAGLRSLAEASLERELTEQIKLWPTADCHEGIDAANERRAPHFLGR